jgi:hypothetical protein
VIHPAPKAPKKRKPDASLRIYGTPEFKAYLHSHPCLWCGVTRPIEQAHFGKHGMGKRLDWTRSGPLCGAFSVPQPKGTYRYVGCHNRLDRRSCLPETWFTAEERHTLELRLRAFHEAYARKAGT